MDQELENLLIEIRWRFRASQHISLMLLVDGHNDIAIYSGKPREIEKTCLVKVTYFNL